MLPESEEDATTMCFEQILAEGPNFIPGKGNAQSNRTKASMTKRREICPKILTKTLN